MEFFKRFQIFEADNADTETVKTEKDKPVEKTETAPVKKDENALPSFRTKVTFRNTFNYNKTNINESFEKTMTEALNQLDEFMKSENQDNKVEVAQINASGFASWVPTNYKGGNPKLAQDRATSVAAEVKKRIEKYFSDKGITKIDWKTSELKGAVDYKNSKEVFHKFIEENYKDRPVKIVEELKKQSITTAELVKEPSKTLEVEKWQTVARLAAKQPDLITKISVDDKNAKQLYELMLESPLYVRGTSKMANGATRIEDKYREATQYAIVEIVINDPSLVSKKDKEEVKPEAVTIESISFDKDVDVADAAGKEAINKLTAYLQKTDASKIKHFILIGHAEADDELKKKYFDPKNDAVLKDAAGKNTIMSEAKLADLRFILSMARCKTVFRAIQNIESVKTIIEKKSFWMLPAGTLYGESLSNQRIVQVVVITSDGQEINTEKDAVPYGKEFQSDTLKKINKQISDLGYTFSKLVPGLIGAQSFAKEVPAHLELAKDVNKLANFKKQYV